VASDHGIISISFIDDECAGTNCTGNDPSSIALDSCKQQLQEYFSGTRRQFDIPLDVRGTHFQLRVWDALQSIPAGQTVTYKQLASRVGNERASRAVGGACNRNPVAIVVPCHRVVGASGAMVGYAPGTWRKEWLIKHERAFFPIPPDHSE